MVNTCHVASMGRVPVKYVHIQYIRVNTNSEMLYLIFFCVCMYRAHESAAGLGPTDVLICHRGINYQVTFGDF